MRQVKSQKKAYELAEAGKLFFINDSFGYSKANVGMVVAMFGKVAFYYKP